jgi:hypothetical protein
MRRISVCVAAVCLVLAAGPVAGAWDFVAVETSTVETYGVDGRFYERDGVTLVKTGAVVQFIVALDGSDIVDPLEYFDTNGNGKIDLGSSEFWAVESWVNMGADPAAISGGTNVLATGVGFKGEGVLDAPGYLCVDAIAETGDPYSIVPGETYDKIAIRVWNLTPTEMENYGTFVHFDGIWCLTDREFTSHNNQGGGPDTGWWIGMPGFEGGGAPIPGDWAGFSSLVGWEVLNGVRERYTLDTYLGMYTLGPPAEPGPSALICATGAMAWLARRKARRKQVLKGRPRPNRSWR